MHLTSIARRRLLAGFVGLTSFIGGGSAIAQPANTTTVNAVKVDARTQAVIVPLGGFGRFDPGVDKIIRDITVSNEDVLGIRPIPNDPKKIDLIGKLGGASQLTLTFSDGSKAAYSIVVQPDYEQLKFVIRQAVPTATVDIIPGVGNVIILSGSVSQPSDADTIVRIASSAVGGNASNVINALQVGGSQHVMIDVTVAQVDRTELRERGFSFGVSGSTASFSSIVGGLATATVGAVGGVGGAGAAGGAGALTFTPGANANIIAGIVPAGVTGALRALKTEGLAKFLSEPKIVTQTGRPAFFRAGGQQAVLSPSSGINGPGVVLTPVGTELEVLPIVYGDGRIYLEVNPRISSVNNGRGITTSFGFTPGFNEQQARSAVMLHSGQTFAIGGLLETTVQANAQKVPYLGELPWIGAAFSSVSHQETETELIILVTPRLVEPMDCNQVPTRVPGRETRSADDYELFVESLIEAPRGQRKIWNKGYQAVHKYDNKGVYPFGGGAVSNGLTTRTIQAPAVTGGTIEPAVVGVPAIPRALPPAMPTPGGPAPVSYSVPALPPVTPIPTEPGK